MHALDFLTQQHRDIDRYFLRLMAEGPMAHEDEEKVLSLLVTTLQTHMDLEEEIFYPAMAERIDAEEFAHAVEEHNVSKPLLEQLDEHALEVESFKAKIEVLKELIDHHVKEEERDLFPRCREAFQALELEAVGKRMEKRLKKDAPELFEDDAATLTV